MVKAKQRKKRPPAKTIEGREEQLIMEAMDLAEDKLLDGTASTQLILHFVKQGSKRELLEQESLRGKMDLDKAKIESIHSERDVLQLYTEAIEAMRRYSGNTGDVVEYNE